MAKILEFPRQRVDKYFALDDMRERGLITPEQHWCGVHMLWLHNIRNGVAPIEEESAWLSARSEEFEKAMWALRDNKCVGAISNLCLFNEWSPSGVDVIRKGLDVLEEVWRKTA